MPVLGATVSHPSLSVHASATYRCSPGYRTAGGDFSHVCQGDGTWSGQRPICEEILCEKIRVPDNSKLLFLSAGLTPGSLTTYKCVPGYTIATGSNETRCTPEGQWASPLPNCTKIDCGTPPAVSNAHTENLTATTFMATAQYVCDEGYKVDVIGAPLVCGKSASWLGEPVVCSEIQCEIPAPPANCYVEAKSHSATDRNYAVQRSSCSGQSPVVEKKSSTESSTTLPPPSPPSGELVKVCSSELQWTGDDPFYVESTGDWDYVIKEDEPKTPKEKMMAKIGYKASDDKVAHMATGIVASVLLVISIALVVALDGPLLFAHLKMRRRKVSYGMRRFQYRTTVFPESHHAAVDRDR
ncbi:hypothetical protein LSAT2_013300 [Lamellibrachia satsuma]|nr:hypothetical protein LSAT2_013300 [Lamellibrachia satsuma]